MSDQDAAPQKVWSVDTYGSYNGTTPQPTRILIVAQTRVGAMQVAVNSGYFTDEQSITIAPFGFISGPVLTRDKDAAP